MRFGKLGTPAGTHRYARSRSLRLTLLLPALVALAACSSTVAAAPPGASPRPTPSNGTVFDKAIPASVSDIGFVNQSGAKVTLASLRGKTVVLTDFLTLCQEICPLTSANFRAVTDAVAHAGLASKVELVEVTVDPQRDTPARLAAYQKLFGARPNWEFLTGTPQQVKQLWGALGVAYGRVPEPKGPLPIDWLTHKPLHYDVNHQDIVFVLGADGREKWLVDGTPNTSGKQPPTTLKKFLDAQGLTNLAHPGNGSWSAADVEQALSYVTGHAIQ